MSTRSDDSSPRKAPSPPDQFAPLISLVFFAYYGFVSSTTSDTTDDAGAPVALWVAFLWTMRAGAAFAAAALAMTLLKARWAHHATIASLLFSSLALAGLGVWDAIDPDYMLACPGLMLWLFVFWAGWHAVAATVALVRGNG